MSLSKDYMELVGQIYEAAYQPDKWHSVLQQIADLTKADSAAIVYRDMEVHQSAITQYFNISTDLISQYNEETPEDPHFELFMRHKGVGIAGTAQELIPQREELDQFYSDRKVYQFTNVMDLYYIAGIVLLNDSTKSFGIGLQRKRATGPWDPEMVQPLTDLAPHLQRALHIHREFTRLRGQQQALSVGLNRMVMGVILFDEFLQPTFTNDIAKSILEHHPALSIRGEQLIAEKPEDTQAIRKGLIKAIAPNSHNQTEHASTAIGITHPDRMTPLPIMITPLAQTEMAHLIPNPGRYVAVLLNDPDKNQPIVPEALTTAYSLTPTEAKVAIAVANGLSTHEVAELHNVKDITVKSQLKAIYRKLGIQRQTELVKLLLTGPFRVNY